METLDELRNWAYKLKELNTIDASDAEVMSLLGQLGSTNIFTAQVKMGSTVIRARTELDFDNSNQILFENQLSYRQDLNNVRRGRCNLDKEAAFYGVLMTEQDKLKAKDRLTCFSEVSKIKVLEEGTQGVEYTTTGIWRVTEPFEVFAFTHHESLSNAHELTAEMKREFARLASEDDIIDKEKSTFFQEFFSEIFGDPDSSYKISSCISSLLFSLGCKGILYPSVQTKGLGLNLALPPSTVINHLRISSALVEKVHKVGKKVVADPFLECYEVNQTDKGNKFVWTEGHAAGKAGLEYLLKPDKE